MNLNRTLQSLNFLNPGRSRMKGDDRIDLARPRAIVHGHPASVTKTKHAHRVALYKRLPTQVVSPHVHVFEHI
jgi:hypothetical protein